MDKEVESLSLPDLCDAHPDLVRVAEPIFTGFGGRMAFGGAIRTVKCFEDNSLVAERVREPGEGRVLVVDGGGSMRCALVGDNLASLAAENGWAGILVYGCVRDVDELAAIDVGIQALGSNPLRSVKRGEGQRDVPVDFAGVRFVPDQFVYCDNNGVVVAPVNLLEI
ncbi:MAG TPA: ribonuclease E activity regulator RraA [Pseudomonadales bacterium]